MRKPYANRITDMLEGVLRNRTRRISESAEVIKKFERLIPYKDMMQELKLIQPTGLRQVCKSLLDKITKLKFSKGELQPDKDLGYWGFGLSLTNDGEYDLSAYFPVNWNKCPEKYRGIEKYHTRDDVLAGGGVYCDLDTAEGIDLPKGVTVYSVAFYFGLQEDK